MSMTTENKLKLRFSKKKILEKRKTLIKTYDEQKVLVYERINNTPKQRKLKLIIMPIIKITNADE